VENEEMVTISKEEYDDLLQDQKILQCLQRAGVDNWEWYDDALSDIDN
jgi:hypothetical protein